jgi:uncharacterized protein (TIGR03000 family)
MYSVVLMTALAAGGNATPAWHHGCHGGCHGCFGGYGGCYGCNGCYGCYGYSGCYGFGGCYGGASYGGGYYGCYGCYGCSGCYGCYGGGYAAPTGGQIMTPAREGASYLQPYQDRGGIVAASSQPARVIVELPEDAKLFVDDQEMKTLSAKRVFRTPSLEPGQTYYYILRAEVARDGKSLSQTKRILVRAGEEVQTALRDLNPVSTAQADIQGKPLAAK